jgi:hypothetical protein
MQNKEHVSPIVVCRGVKCFAEVVIFMDGDGSDDPTDRLHDVKANQ